MDKFGYFTFLLGLAGGVLFILILNQYDTVFTSSVLMYSDSVLSGMAVLWNPKEISKPGKYENSYFYRVNGTRFEIIESELSKRLEEENFDPWHQRDLLYSNVKILCQVYVSNVQLGKLGKSILDTWGTHCNKLVIVSSAIDQNLKDLYYVDIPDKPEMAWEKTKQGFRQAFERYRNEYHYFLKVDSSMVVVLENLRYLLFVHNTSIPGYAGHVFLDKAGRSSIVVSRMALEKLQTKLNDCPSEVGGKDDASELTRCFQKVGIISSTDGRDYKGRLRFEMTKPDHKLPSNAGVALSFGSLYWRYIKFPQFKGPECCYEYAIMYSDVKQTSMYYMEYMVYHLRPFGVGQFKCAADSDADNKLALQQQQEKEIKEEKKAENEKVQDNETI
ncbi:glycoprotein-N-acetylgalactosamine 3-beta-galactosyltransferase 1-like [Ptychodera flava]|uniref:glycoprotein-N-acetylgalactosamine 3-beta-galactosyltransferase 1-like n=1 Tax=Ptychodera flava TaxID=63121 RepID=UPI00396A36A2